MGVVGNGFVGEVAKLAVTAAFRIPAGVAGLHGLKLAGEAFMRILHVGFGAVGVRVFHPDDWRLKNIQDRSLINLAKAQIRHLELSDKELALNCAAF